MNENLNKSETAEDVFKEFEDFITKNPGSPVPRELEDRYQKAEAMNATSKQEVAEPQTESPFRKGEERIAAIGNVLEKTKNKTKTVISNVGGSMSRFWNRTKDFGKKAVFAAFSVDDLAKKGYEAVDEWTDKKAAQAGEYLGEKGAQAQEWTKDKINLTGEKINQASEWADTKAVQFTNFVEKKYEDTTEFTKNKAEIVKQFAIDKVELTKDIAFYAKEKTNEGFLKAKTGLENSYSKIKNFSENSIASAKMEASRIKDAYHKKMNAIRMRRLEAKFGKASDKASRLAVKMELLALVA